MNAYRTRLARLRTLFPPGAPVVLEDGRTATVVRVAPLASATLVVWVRVPSCVPAGAPGRFTDVHRLPRELTPPEGSSA